MNYKFSYLFVLIYYELLILVHLIEYYFKFAKRTIKASEITRSEKSKTFSKQLNYVLAILHNLIDMCFMLESC